MMTSYAIELRQQKTNKRIQIWNNVWNADEKQKQTKH